jgi:hypothetical protein
MTQQDINQLRLESPEHFLKMIPEVRSVYDLPDEQAVFEKTIQKLREQGAVNLPFYSLSEFEKYQQNMLNAKMNGTWNICKHDYRDESLPIIERQKAYFDSFVKNCMNNRDICQAEAFYMAASQKNTYGFLFPSYEQYLNYLTNN